MKPLFFVLLTPLFCCSLIFSAACRQSPTNGGKVVFSESFERGSKRAYAAGAVVLESGRWKLDGALIGGSDADRRNGGASLRLAAGGRAEMDFDLKTLPDTLSLRFGTYGNDRPVRLSVWYSNNGGVEWKPLSMTNTAPGPAMATLEIAMVAGYRAPIRFRLQNDGAGRLNVDDITSGRLPGIAHIEHSGTDSAGHPGTKPSPDGNLLLGNPSDARPDPRSETNYLHVRPQYTLSYNNARGTANWVGWHLSREEQGKAPRCNCFSADASLPEGFYRVQSSNYIGTGFDRGHICASDDRSGSPDANAATFLMPNIAPQAPDLNQKCWKDLEEYLRRLTVDGKELYVISGVYGEGGTGSKGAAKRIGNGRITVPGHFWKIALVLPEGDNDLKRITAETEVIAVDMPNTQSAGKYSWQSFRCTVGSIEKATGYRFFSALPTAIANALRRR